MPGPVLQCQMPEPRGEEARHQGHLGRSPKGREGEPASQQGQALKPLGSHLHTQAGASRVNALHLCLHPTFPAHKWASWCGRRQNWDHTGRLRTFPCVQRWVHTRGLATSSDTCTATRQTSSSGCAERQHLDLGRVGPFSQAHSHTDCRQQGIRARSLLASESCPSLCGLWGGDP